VLRRRISATSADIAATRRKKKGLTKLTGGKDSLDKIGKLLDRHPGLKDQQAQVINLTAIVKLVDKWLDAHAGEKDRDMVALLEDVKAEARRDLGQAQAQLRYVNDLRAGEALSSKDKRLEHQPTATPITQQLTAKMATKASWAMGYAGQEWRDADPRKKIADLIRDTGLTEAEVAAIKLFTANDYLYLNPAVANSDSWLQGQMKEIGGLSEGMADYAGPRTAVDLQLVRQLLDPGVAGGELRRGRRDQEATRRSDGQCQVHLRGRRRPGRQGVVRSHFGGRMAVDARRHLHHHPDR
jgi:hypothetical protein